MTVLDDKQDANHRNILERRLTQIDKAQKDMIDTLNEEQKRTKQSLLTEKDQTI